MRLQAVLADLRPANGDADQARRPDPAELGDQGVRRRTSREDVGGAPEHRAEHLEEPAERVEQREIAQQDFVPAHRGQRGGPREPLRDQAVVTEDHTFRHPGAARREHDRCRSVQIERTGGQQRVDPAEIDLRAGVPQRRYVEIAQVLRRREVPRAKHPERCPGLGPHLSEALEALVAVGDHDVDREAIEDPGERVGVRVDVDRRHEDAVEQAGQVGAGTVDAVLGKDGDSGRRLGGEEDRGERPRVAGHLRVRPTGRVGLPRVVEEHAVWVRRDALLEQRAKRVARMPDRAERGVGPPQSCRVIGQVFEVGRTPRGVEIRVPVGRVAGGSGRQLPFGGLQQIERGAGSRGVAGRQAEPGRQRRAEFVRRR